MNVLYFFFIFVTNSLTLSTKKYITSKLPQTDLKVISQLQTNIISKLWYEQIINDRFNKLEDSQENIEFKDQIERAYFKHNKLENMANNHILAGINTLESYFQSPKKDYYLYLSWMPMEINTQLSKDVLALIVCEKYSKTIILKSIIPNPSWYSENIDPKELKKCLFSLENNQHIINVTEFYNNPDNIRFKLDWSL